MKYPFDFLLLYPPYLFSSSYNLSSVTCLLYQFTFGNFSRKIVLEHQFLRITVVLGYLMKFFDDSVVF